MDVTCANCREPWDVSHITHDAFGSWSNLRRLLEKFGQEEVIEDNDGGAWILDWFNGIDDVAEGHVMILQCPACIPRPGKEGCPACAGSGRVYVKKLVGSKDPLFGKWFYGFGDKAKPGPGPFQPLKGYVCKDGRIQQGVAHCPRCFNNRYQYFEAMEDEGWDLEEMKLTKKAKATDGQEATLI